MLGDFRYLIEGTVARFFPQSNIGNEADALAALQLLIKAWNLDALLQYGPDAFALEYVGGDTDREATHALDCAPTSSAQILHAAYPPPPVDVAVDDCVSELAAIYVEMLRQPERIVNGGRACLTVIETRFGSRQAASESLNLDVSLLNKLSEITRAWGREAPEKPRFSTWRTPRWLTTVERAWLLDLSRELTRRAARYVAGYRTEETLTRMPQ